MTQSRSFLGETADRENAFPDIISLDLIVVQDPFEQYTQYSSQRKKHFNKETITRCFACANPRCQQGGLDLQQIVTSSPSGRHTFRCSGHESTSKGRRKGSPCGNSYDITISVERRCDT